MNERIKELASRVDWSTDTTYDELTKFAELIIRECLTQIKDIVDYTRPTNDEYELGFNNCLDESIETIEEYFGVEP